MNKEYFVPFTKFESDLIDLNSFKPKFSTLSKEIFGYLKDEKFFASWVLPNHVINGNPIVKSVEKEGITIQYQYTLPKNSYGTSK